MTDQELTKPHMAILSIQLEVSSLLDTGECSGKVLRRDVLEKHGISDALLLTVSGKTMEDCLEKLKAKIEAFKND